MGTVIYDGDISGGAISAVVTTSGANYVPIPYANGMKVLIIKSNN